jgi:ADP-ribose pyrophosphatase YjhB (NUDIX family)
VPSDLSHHGLLTRPAPAPNAGDWELPGGHVDPGESAAEAAVRETAEESGITVQITGLAGIYTYPGHVIADPRTGLVRQPFAVCFHARPLSGSPGGDQVETSDARWFTTGDIAPCRSARPCGCGSATRSSLAAPATSADVGHQTCVPPVVTLPAQISAATAEQAAEPISAAARGGQARFAIRPGGDAGFPGGQPGPGGLLQQPPWPGEPPVLLLRSVCDRRGTRPGIGWSGISRRAAARPTSRGAESRGAAAVAAVPHGVS